MHANLVFITVISLLSASAFAIATPDFTIKEDSVRGLSAEQICSTYKAEITKKILGSLLKSTMTKGRANQQYAFDAIRWYYNEKITEKNISSRIDEFTDQKIKMSFHINEDTKEYSVMEATVGIEQLKYVATMGSDSDSIQCNSILTLKGAKSDLNNASVEIEVYLKPKQVGQELMLAHQVQLGNQTAAELYLKQKKLQNEQELTFFELLTVHRGTFLIKIEK